MKKAIKYAVGVLGLIMFFLLLDDSGVGFKEHIKKLQSWANK